MLGEAYRFPAYYSHNLDSAEEILEDLKEEQGAEKLSLRAFFDTLLSDATPIEQEKIWAFILDHFEIPSRKVEEVS